MVSSLPACADLITAVFDFAHDLSALKLTEHQIALFSALVLINTGKIVSSIQPKEEHELESVRFILNEHQGSFSVQAFPRFLHVSLTTFYFICPVFELTFSIAGLLHLVCFFSPVCADRPCLEDRGRVQRVQRSVELGLRHILQRDNQESLMHKVSDLFSL